MKSVLYPVALMAVSLGLHAQAPVLDETFATGDRSTQNPPASLAWYVAGASTNLTVKTSALDLAANGAQRDLWAYFPAVTLKVGDSIALTLNLSFTTAPAQVASGLRFSLGYSNGLPPTTANGTAPSGNYQAYGSFTDPTRSSGATRLRKRNGPAAGNATAPLLEVNDGASPIWNDLSTTTGLAGPTQANVPYTATLRITRTGNDTASVTMSFSGGTLDTSNAFTLTDTSGIYTTFDTIALDLQGALLAGDLLITRAQLTTDIGANAVVNDTFADGDRVTQNPPASLAWYQTSGSLTVKNGGALDMVVANNPRLAWAYFPALNLKVGDTATLALDFSLTSPLVGSLRLGLLNTNGLPPIKADGPSPTGNYQGYGLFTNTSGRVDTLKRNGPGGAAADSLLVQSIGTGPDTIWNNFGNSGNFVAPSLPNTAYSLSLRITRTSASSVTLLATLTGGTLGSGNAITFTDSTSPFTQFDTIAFGFITASLTGDLIVTRANLSVTSIPVFAVQPLSRGVIVGANALFTAAAAGSANFQWQRKAAGSTLWANLPENGTYSGTATSALLVTSVVNNMNGDQFRAVISNSAGSSTSDAATLSLVAPAAVGFISNLSILTSLADASDSFTMGYVVGGDGTAGTKPLVIRAVGPSLGALGVPGTVADPKIDFYAGQTRSGSNDNWGGASDITTAMAGVGAFPFVNATSKDAAVFASLPKGGNSIVVSATGSGTVIAEIYDASPALAAATPRLINVSVLKPIGTGLTAGFTIGGSNPKPVLVRAIGPTLAVLGVGGVLADPQLAVNSNGTIVAQNDDWGGTAALTAAFNQTGAFLLSANSKDAALVVTLPPGGYTAQVTGAGGAGGIVLVEIYELP